MPARRTTVVLVVAAGALLGTSCTEGSPAVEDAAPATTASTTAATSTTAAPPAPTTSTTTTPSALRAADDPAGLAQQLAASEATIRDPAATAEQVDAAGRLAQLAYRRLAVHPEWDPIVLAAIDPALQPAVTLTVSARRELRSIHTTLSDTLPAWRIVEPLPADQLLSYYQEAEAAFGVPWYVLASVNLVETAMGRIQGLSVAGAQGPMQFMPGTWDAYGMGGDVEDPHDAIMGAANYLAANGAADGTDAGLDNALHHYNHSDPYVRGVRALAAVMQAEPVTIRGFHAWDVVYASTLGEVRLDPGYETADRIPVADYLATHPDAAIT